MQFGFSPLDAAMSYTLFPILLILLFLMISWTGTQYLPLFILRPLPSFQLFWCILLFLWNLALSSSIASIASTLTFHPLCVISPSLFLLHVSSSSTPPLITSVSIPSFLSHPPSAHFHSSFFIFFLSDVWFIVSVLGLIHEYFTRTKYKFFGGK